MNEVVPLSQFIDFIKTANPRFLQERDVGLDIYFNGVWGILPGLLLVVSLTIFFLALFQLLSSRRVSLPLILGVGILALAIGVVGAYFNCRELPIDLSGAAVPKALLLGRGARPQMASQQAAVLNLPFYLGLLAFLQSLLEAFFLLLFGRPEAASQARAKKAHPA